MPAIPPHKTATTDVAWDGSAAKANLKADADEAYYRKAYAWQDPDGDPKTKAAYKFIHHMVSSDGTVGAANLTACSTGIGVLNGGRAGTNIPGSDRRGVYNHLAKHLRDAGKEAPDLKGIVEMPTPVETGDPLECCCEPLHAAEEPERVPLALEVFSADRPWAITPRGIKALLRAAQHPDFEAVAARLGKPVENGNGRDVENHNGAAVVNIRGPLFRYRSIFTWLLGGTSVEETSLALHAALDDPAIKRVVLAMNSPGGQIDGINELANSIRAANEQKPVTAYVDGLAGSGAYWLASAAGKIVTDETAQLGSIGVLATVMDDREAEERRGVKRYDVISSQSPLKRSDPASDEGRQQLQEMVDAMAQVFIEKVARFRGVDPERVQRDFGGGAVLPARKAIRAGMADRLGSLRGLLAQMPGRMPIDRMPMNDRDMPMDDDGRDMDSQDSPGDRPIRRIKDEPQKRVKARAAAATPAFDEEELEEETEDERINDDSSCTCPPGTETCQCGAAEKDEEDEDEDEKDDDEEDEDEKDEAGDEREGTEQKPDESSIPRKGVGDLIKPTVERQRIAAILTCEEARGREELARTLALETNHTIAAAKKLLAVAPLASKANALEARMGQIPNPKVGIPGDAGEDDSNAAEAMRVLAFVPKHLKRAHVQ